MTRCPLLSARIAREVAVSRYSHARSTREQHRTAQRLRAATCALMKLENEQ